MYQFVIDSRVLQPYLAGVRPLVELPPSVAAHVMLLRDWQALRAATRPPAVTFADLDPRSQAIYAALAAALPGCTLYATGSRVQGTWRSGAPDDPKTAIARRLGKPLESDVDVVVLGVDNRAFRQAVAPVAARYGVRIDRQPMTITVQVLVPQEK
jgi:hypothetical protein